ncbi:hypothetical protein O3P69_006206 [Scylla paramamosain]|uniref:Mutator-like transposase domain-containing protein n=1 Tax=Scylla paramamosain TaxID=85552 RepID=A0AAW0U5V4_SCYPA
MGRRKRKTIAWSEAARKRMKVYWDRKSKETSATPTPSTSTCGEAGGAGDTVPLRITPSPADEASPADELPVITPAMERERFLAGKLVDEGFVIEMTTGFVMDFELLSNFCKSCSTKKKQLNDEEKFEEWRKNVHVGMCQANFHGLSGRMEAECAIRMWGRSENLGFQYTTFLSDGDSSAFTAVTAMNNGAGPYNVQVEKEECVNHVKKRMGTRLRKLKEELKEEKVTKTGKVIRRSVVGENTN